MAKELSPAQCILLTIHYASEANIKALHSFTPTRLDALAPELVLRILLTYLPESLEPQEYTTYISEVASRLYLDVDREHVEVDALPIKDISEEQAKRKVKRLQLLDIHAPTWPPHAPKDALTRFLCHRAHRIDAETGLLNLVPQLVEPFLERNQFLRTWYISVVLPLLRLEFEYHPDDETLGMSLGDFEKMEGRKGIDFLLQKVARPETGNITPAISAQESEVARDIKGLVGPWMYGDTERKRRKLNHGHADQYKDDVEALSGGMRKIGLEGVTSDDKTDHDWEDLYRWMVFQAVDNFPLISSAVENWDGPADVDLGGFNPGNSDHYLEDDVHRKLLLQYAQTAFASCYCVQADTQQTVQDAHSILARLAELLDFIPPPDLATSVESLPKIERHATLLEDSQTDADLEPDSLLKPEHPLTTPRLETYMLLQVIIYSAYQFSSLGYAISLVHVAKLHLHASAAGQLIVLQKILHGVSKGGARKDESQWSADRAKLMWLWNWGIDANDENATEGAGALGRIRRETFEQEMLKCFVDTSCYNLAINLCLKTSTSALSREQAEQIVLSKAMEAYDSASNGNRTRGGLKKASDIITTFRPYFPDSVPFRQAIALIAATHSLSFYSLTLQHGVPFQPVSIRVSHDPIGLVSKVLEQNTGSYTKLDDLIDVGRNLASAGLLQLEGEIGAAGQVVNEDPEELESKRKNAERRVTFMGIEAALKEDDFETAYSYIVSRLTPSGADIEAPKSENKSTRHIRDVSRDSTQSSAALGNDDISWRAAFLAGRYRGANSSPSTLRRLEQRTELLSIALLLAPDSALTEILAAWRRCEEETTALHASQQAEEEEFDDRADKRQSLSSLPGNFTMLEEQPALVLGQKRREIGRINAGSGKAGDEAPMSMFDLTRSAAQAFSKNAFPLRGAAKATSSHDGGGGMESSVGSLVSEGGGADGQQRVRKRDMVASAVSGGLASGLGWVLGATPTSQQE